MARRIVHQLVDDIDGTVLEVGDGETVHFSLGGNAYEIDLSAENAEALRTALDPYIAAGRRASHCEPGQASMPISVFGAASKKASNVSRENFARWLTAPAALRATTWNTFLPISMP